MSSRPKRSTALATARSTLASSVTSMGKPSTSAPSLLSRAAVATAAAWSMSAAATFAPDSASART